MLTEMEAVAPGFLNKFIKSKMHNHCRRVHNLLSTTLHALHFQTFMQDEEFSDKLKDELRKWVSDDNDVIPESLDMIALKYGMYCKDTMSDTCGKTAKFWTIYCHLVDLYLHGAMKTCDGAHNEADTHGAFHAVHVEQLNPGNTVIRCYDRDTLIIMLLNIQKFSQSHVWLDMRLDYNNLHIFINVKGTADKLNYIHALPGIYPFTRCNYTPAFFRKGKKIPIEMMLKSVPFVNTFNKMGEEDLSDKDIDAIESFTCSIFGYSKIKYINEARYLHFKNKCKPKAAAKPLDCLKNVDPCLLPPCKDVLMQQIKRSWFHMFQPSRFERETPIFPGDFIFWCFNYVTAIGNAKNTL